MERWPGGGKEQQTGIKSEVCETEEEGECQYPRLLILPIFTLLIDADQRPRKKKGPIRLRARTETQEERKPS